MFLRQRRAGVFLYGVFVVRSDDEEEQEEERWWRSRRRWRISVVVAAPSHTACVFACYCSGVLLLDATTA